MMKKLLLLFVVSFFFALSFKSVSAQACGGSFSCCSEGVSTRCRDANGDGISDNADRHPITGACLAGSENYCPGTTSNVSCSSVFNQYGVCSPYVPSCNVFEGNCYPTGSCPAGSGTIYCGGSLQTCCPNTNSCNYWIAQGGCGGGLDPDPPGPTPPPQACTPRAAGWTANRPQFTFAQGGTSSPNWDPVEGRYFLRTNNDDGMITVGWSQPAGDIDSIEYRFIPVDVNTGLNLPDSGGNSGCDHIRARCGTVSGGTTSLSFRPRDNRYFRMRLRFRHNCQSRWSGWRDFIVRIDGQVTGRIFILEPGATATQTGPNGSCLVSGAATSPLNTTMTVTATGGGYTYTDPALGSANARYRVFLPYQNPGAITIGVNNMPSNYTVACPVGGSYNSGNSTIPAPFLSNGTNGTMVQTHIYLCNAGSAMANPTAANITSPTQNQQVVPSFISGQYRINLNFSKPSTALVEYRLRPAGTPAGQECTAPGTQCGTIPDGSNSTTSTVSFIPTASAYVLDMRFTQIACNTTQATAWSPVRNFTVVGQVSGTVFDDPSGTASGNYCSDAGGLMPSSSGQIFTNFVGATSNRVGGNFTLTIPWGAANTGDVAYQDGTTVCGCPGSCTYNAVPKVATGVNFYRTDNSDSWWQVQGGPVLALGEAGVVVQSYIPASCSSPACEPYLIRRSSGAGTSGYVITGQSQDLTSAGQVDLRRDAGIDQLFVDQDLNNIIASTNPSVVREVYAEFIRRYKFTSERLRLDDFDGQDGRPFNEGASKPDDTPRNGVNAYWTGNDLTIDQAWNVGAGESIVVLVDGDVTIESPIDVAQGGFLAIITSGNITVDPDVGVAAASTTGVVEGVYIADGTLNFPSRGIAGGGDLKFVGEGTFVGWSGVTMDRDFNDGGGGAISNNTYPTEFFIYRPDFLLNAPPEMAQPRFVWREVAP